MWRNTTIQFGWIAIGLHWLMALVIFGLFGVGLYMVDLTYYDDLYKTLPEIHKSIGLLLVLPFVFRWLWRAFNPTPDPVAGSRPIENRMAHLAHVSMYVLIALILFSGYLISTAEGAPIPVFDWFDVPATLSGLPKQEDRAGLVHEYLAYLLIGLVLVHSLAALKHHFINCDNSLRRMLGLRGSNN